MQAVVKHRTGDFMRWLFLTLIMLLAPLGGCFGENAVEIEEQLTVGDVSSATRGQYMTLEVDSTVDWMGFFTLMNLAF
jgi:hypothetical protein